VDYEAELSEGYLFSAPESGRTALSMKTTVELPDELVIAAKKRAAEGTPLNGEGERSLLAFSHSRPNASAVA